MRDERNVKILEPVTLIITVSIISVIALAINGYSFVTTLLKPEYYSQDNEKIWKLIIQGVDILIMLVSTICLIMTIVQLKKFGTPFIAEVINGMNFTAFSVMVGGMVHMLLVGLYPMIIAINSYNMAGYGDYTYGCGAMLFGGFLMACTELLKYGIRTAKPSEKPAAKEEKPAAAIETAKDAASEGADIVKEIRAAEKEAAKENIE